MHYEINVAKASKVRKPYPWNPDGYEYFHYFATADRSLTTRAKTWEVYQELIKAFPKPEYDITISCERTTGEHLTPEDLQDE